MAIRISIISKSAGQTRVTIPIDVVRETGFDQFDLVRFEIDDRKRIIIEGFSVSKESLRPTIK